ncbi:MAG: glycosyltransferase family 4 protein [Lachnospirales bacterium]
MKVINIISDTNIGGAGKCLISYIDNYEKKFDIIVYIPEKSLLKNKLDERNIAYRELPYINEMSFNKNAISHLIESFKIDKPDIVHCHATFSGRLAAKIYGTKIIYTRHSYFEQNKSNSIKTKIKNIINNYLCHIAIAVSPATKINLLETGIDSGKIRIVYNGVDKLKKYNDEGIKNAKKKYGTETDFNITILARLEEVKGHKYVLECATKLKEYPDIKFLIAGTGTEEEKLKEIINNLKLKNVNILGFVNNVEELLNATDIQINCSYGTEATSLALLEGMSIGIPAIVSDFGGNPYVIKNGYNGYTYPVHTTNELYENILILYNNKNIYNRISENSITEYNNRFTSKVMANEITKVYEEAFKL